jgi:hypothetical protein
LERDRNIFYNIITNENHMTELFCNLLSFKYFRNVFLKMFLNNDNEIANVDYENIYTQYSLLDYASRPDMAIHNDDLEILLEVKVGNTPLTNNQPDTYLKYLENSRSTNKWMIFVIPSNYYKKNYLSRKLSDFIPMKGKINTKIIYWEQIIKEIEKNGLHLYNDYFRDFHGLLKTWYEDKKIYFNYEEVNSMVTGNIPDILIKLYEIIRKVKDNNGVGYKTHINSNSHEYGLYIRDEKGSLVLYVGVWYEFWKEKNHPICFGLKLDEPSKELLKIFASEQTDHYIDFKDWRMSWIDSSVMSKDNCSDDIVNIIGDMLAKLSQKTELVK